MKPISWGDTERLLCPGAPQGPALFHREGFKAKCLALCVRLTNMALEDS